MTAHHHHLFQLIFGSEVIRALCLCLNTYDSHYSGCSHNKILLHLYFLLYDAPVSYFHGEGNAVPTTVYLDDSDLYVLMKLHYIERMGDTAIGHL